MAPCCKQNKRCITDELPAANESLLDIAQQFIVTNLASIFNQNNWVSL